MKGYVTLNPNSFSAIHAPIYPIDASDDCPILCREGEGGSEAPIDHSYWMCSEVPSYFIPTASCKGDFFPRKFPDDCFFW